METFQEVAESQKMQEENKDACATAEALEKLTVEEKNKDKAAEEAPAAATEVKPELKEENEKKEDEKKAEDSSA